MIDRVSSHAYRKSLGETFRTIFRPWSKITPAEWAETVYRLPNGGKFSFEYAPYVKAMHAAIFDKLNSEVVFQLYSRGLKSTAVLLALGFIIDQAPRRILNLWPTNKHAELYRKDNLNKELLDCTPCLQYLGSGAKKRTGENTLLHFGFPGGLFSLFGANAPGDMRRAKGSFLYGEEIDAITTEETDEGDQLAIFNKRGDEYPDTIKVFASYPALKILDASGNPLTGHSRINTKMMRSDECEWYSTCEKCGGEPFIMHPDQITAEKGKAEDARFQCPRCNAFLDDAARHRMAHKQGFDNWKPKREFRGIRGFHANAMLWPHPTDPVKMPGGALQMIAQQREDAENSDNVKRSKRTFVNMVCGEPFDPLDETETPPDWKTLFERRENYEVIPQKGAFLTAFADVQRDRIEVGWRVFDRDEESWGLRHVVLDGYTGHQEVWDDLLQELKRTFPHESGAKLGLGQAFIDGGAYAEEVYRFFQRLARNPVEGVSGKVFASKGYGKHGMPIVTRKVSTVSKNLKGNEIGTWEAKDRVYARLRMKESGPQFMHFNQSYGEAYFRQLTVEKVTIEFDGGQEIRKYENEHNERNEALDIEVGCLAALRRVARNWDVLEARIMEDAEALRTGKPRETAAWFPAEAKAPSGWTL